MLAGFGSGFNFSYQNGFGNAVTVTPGASLAEGNWTTLATGASLTQDIWFIQFMLTGLSSVATNRRVAIDLGIDPAGGTTYTAVMNDLITGHILPAGAGGLGHFYAFPYFVKAGTSVGMRAKMNVAAGPTFLVGARFYGQPYNPQMARAGTYFVDTGNISGITGTPFTPGSTGANGAWVSLGTLARPAWWHQLGVCGDTATHSIGVLFVDLAVGNATVKQMIIERKFYSIHSDEYMSAELNLIDACFDLPAGAELFIRASFSAAPVGAWSGRAISVGG